MQRQCETDFRESQALVFKRIFQRLKSYPLIDENKPKLTPHQQAEAIKRRDKGETLTDIARSYNVSHTTISRLTGEI
jgi:DNA invertase Pin-like site-specific DNA recombinase